MGYKYFLWPLLVIQLLACYTEQATQWSVTNNQEGVLILEHSDSVLFYQRTTKSLEGKYARANYIHPLYGLNQTVLTEDFPEDHLHHRGIFWAWHQNYIGKKSVGDGWALENFSWVIKDVQVDQYADSCVLRTEVHWESPLWLNEQGKQKPFIQEEANITIHATKGNYRLIDFRIQLHALEDSLFIGGSEDEKGYSGFSWRIPLSEDVIFTSLQGKIKPQTLAVDAGPWMNISGNLDSQDGQEGLVVISQPDNPGHPQPWILRNSRSMQNAAYPGRNKVLIPRDTPLSLKYRLILYDNAINDKLIQKLSAFK